jgi:phosphoglycolate phosphatase-like HAD superfamily hydrolase
MPTKLLLFDIDGTLITSGGAGEKALRRGLKTHFGIEEDLATIEIAGRTDTGIARRIFEKHGIEHTESNLRAFLEAYLVSLEEFLPTIPGRRLAGTRELLEALQPRSDIMLGLLTGNLRRGAQLKLQHYGLWDYFVLGAFADDHHDRNQLGPFAQERARKELGQPVIPEHIYILGDTPHDIACARAIGAQAVAVSTGIFSRENLSAHAPDYLFEDFSDPQAVLATLFGS